MHGAGVSMEVAGVLSAEVGAAGAEESGGWVKMGVEDVSVSLASGLRDRSLAETATHEAGALITAVPGCRRLEASLSKGSETGSDLVPLCLGECEESGEDEFPGVGRERSMVGLGVLQLGVTGEGEEVGPGVETKRAGNRAGVEVSGCGVTEASGFGSSAEDDLALAKLAELLYG